MEPGGNRYYTLDAMRGLAAMLVVAFHVGLRGDPIPYGYLAVDFFFALSGFVVSRAYSPQLAAGLSFGRFMRRRVIRLYPMYLLGLLVGLGAALIEWPLQGDKLVAGLLALPANLLMLPAVTGPQWFPLNGAHWSLLLEIAVNLVFAAVLWRISTRWLIAVTLAAGCLVAIAAVRANSLNWGWDWDGGGFGAARCLFGFGFGMIAARLVRHRRQTIWAFATLAGLTAVMALPVLLSGAAYPLVAALVLLPIILVLGIVCELPAVFRPIAGLMADVSYPLYAIHLPLVWFFQHAPPRFGLTGGLRALVTVGVLSGLAWVASVWIDRPARAWLSARAFRQAAA